MISSPSLSYPLVAEPRGTYGDRGGGDRWLEVLVNRGEIDDLLTYRIPPSLEVQSGDIILVPLQTQIVKGIAIRSTQVLPPHLAPRNIRNIIDIIAKGIFSSTYLQLLEKVATYYFAPRIVVFRSALPPGTLKESQRRICLNSDLIPQGAEVFCSPVARNILELLKQSKEEDYSAKHIHRKIKGASKGLKDLIKRGWVTSYLAPPNIPRPKRQKVVILVSTNIVLKPLSREEKAMNLLQRLGGEGVLSELHKSYGVDYNVIKSLETKGCVLVEEQEVLRFSSEPKIEKDSPKPLNFHQATALESIKNLKGFAGILLHGVTGSGKTEVYLQVISHILEQRKSAIVLVPEISLTPQLTDRFRARFGEQVCVYHSALNEGERYDTWRFLLSDKPHIVIGTRSAVFTPVPNLGLIILDEEHDYSFKQHDRTPNYHARTVAQWRAELENCPLILGSATPASETWHTHTLNPTPQTHYLSLPDRIHSRPLPPVEVVDMRRELKQGNRSIFSVALQDALKQLKPTGKKGILFIPRRGHSTFVSCRSCGYVIECPRCDVSLSYHHVREGANQILRCHYCNHSTLHPSECPECASPYLKFFGSGTQKVVRAIEKDFPDLRVIRFDSDTTRGKGAHRSKLTEFAEGEADLLVGTQMLTKGLDVAQVTLVGILAADGLLHLADYRASERAFQTLTQVAGRAGRGDDPGRVILQTYTPDHPVVGAVCNHDYLSFARETLLERSQLNYPPYGRLILLRLSGLHVEEVEEAAHLVAQGCHNLLATLKHELLGPAPASIMRIDRRYRWQILLKFPLDVDNLPDLSQLKGLCPQSVRLTIDVDPLSIS
ncbi:MAG: primosomal protein N' [Spirulina sp.]